MERFFYIVFFNKFVKKYRMKRIIKYILILLSPFFLMVIINESVRFSSGNKSYSYKNFKRLNSTEYRKDKCTWACHDNTTSHCKVYHSNYAKPYFKYTDGYYFGITNLLMSTGNYKLANIILYCIISPLWVWIFIIKIIKTQRKINKLKQ